MSEKRDIRVGDRVSADEIAESEFMHYEGNCIRPPPEAFSISLKSSRELKDLRERGLDRIYLGVETGVDEISQNRSSQGFHCYDLSGVQKIVEPCRMCMSWTSKAWKS